MQASPLRRPPMGRSCFRRPPMRRSFLRRPPTPPSFCRQAPKWPPLASARARLVERAQAPGLAQQGEHAIGGLGAMAEPVLGARVELGDAAAERRDEDQRVVAEAARRRAARSSDLARASGRPRSAARGRRRGARATSVLTKRARAVGDAAQALEQQRGCWRRPGAAQRLAVVVGRALDRREVRRRTPGAPPSASTHRPESSASAGSRRARAPRGAPWRARSRRRSRAARRPRRCRARPAATSSMPSGASSAPQLAQLAARCCEARTSFTSRPSRRASAARCARDQLARCPCSARPSSASISARENGAPSAVPCTSTKPPAPVITTFMSVSQAESSA